MKDFLIMDKIREYDPDMFLWAITLDSFRNRTIFKNYFLNPYATRVRELVDEYHLVNLDIENLSHPTFWDRTIISQRSRLKKIFLLQLHGVGWSATNLDYFYQSWQPLSQDQSREDMFFDASQHKLEPDNMLFDVLEAGYELSGNHPLLVVNEPIFIASGANSDIRYNEFYPRWAYDEYLNYLDQWMRINHHDYLNAWNLLPSSEFTDTPFHRTPAGEEAFAEYLVPQILNLSCTK
jgi:hypothetical protein